MRDETDYQRHLTYRHFHPVKHGLVAAVGTGPIPVLSAMFGKVCIRRSGPELKGRNRE
jgi:hypothetical protein